MSFPNAARGIGKIFIAEIVELIATIVLGCGATALVYGLSHDSDQTLVIGGLVIVVALAAMVFAYIFNMVGVKNASNDEDCFQTAFIMIIFELVLVVVAAIFAQYGTRMSLASNLASTFQRLANLFCTYYILTGASNILYKLGKEDLAARGSNIAMTILILNIAGCVLNAIPIFTPNVIDYICYGIFAVVLIITYILFLSFLVKAKNAIKKA